MRDKENSRALYYRSILQLNILKIVITQRLVVIIVVVVTD